MENVFDFLVHDPTFGITLAWIYFIASIIFINEFLENVGKNTTYSLSCLLASTLFVVNWMCIFIN